jgi:hypothetical protein
MSRDHSREVHGTNEHATMLASRQHIKLLFRDGQKSVYCACKGGVIGAEARDPVSNWQICVLSLGGLVPFNTAIPPEFLFESAHIYGDSVRNCSGSGAPGIVLRVSSHLCTYLI